MLVNAQFAVRKILTVSKRIFD